MRKAIFGLLVLVTSILLIACSGSAGDVDEPDTWPGVKITGLKDGDPVPVIVWLNGTSNGIAPGRVPDAPSPWIYVVLRPIPGDPNQSWWVQPHPLVHDDGRWDATVFAGLETDPPGTPYIICAIVSNEEIKVGLYGEKIPVALSRECVSVMRG